MSEIKVLIADDHAIVRTGLAALLETKPGISVVGEAADGAAAVKKALRLRPDVIIMDLMMPVKDGVEATREIHEKLPESRVLILTTSTAADLITRAIEVGATGVITKSGANDQLVQAIRSVAAGNRTLSPEVSRLVAEETHLPELTERQLDILHSITRGLSNAEIARQFDIAEITVKNHLTAIFSKLGAANRTEAVTIALRHQLLKT